MPYISSEEFGLTSKGEKVTKYTFKNSRGTLVAILDYGGIIHTLEMVDKEGKMDDITLGFDNVADYESKSPYFGAICGRVANIIKPPEFELDGEKFTLFPNRPPVTVHGGKEGFDKKIWSAKIQDDALILSYVSPDGEEGYPGELTTQVSYTLADDDTLTLEYKATTSKPTIINLTNHAYFNLGGHGHGHLSDHQLTVQSEKFLTLDGDYVPTGNIESIEGTKFDFRSARHLEMNVIKSVCDGLGLMNTFPLDNDGALKLAARVDHEPSGRYVEYSTTEPGVGVYTSGFLSDVTGKQGANYQQFCAFSLEGQHFPSSIHHPNFPSTILRPGETFTAKTIYKFGVK